MYQIGIFPDEITQDFERALYVMKELGASIAELRSMWGKNIIDLPDDDLSRAKKMLEKSKFTVSCIASPFLKCNLRGEEGAKGDTFMAADRSYEQQLDVLRHSMELAEMFDTKLVRSFAFWREEELTEEIWQEIFERFREPVEMVRKKGFILALENEHACYVGSAEESLRLLKEINSPHLRLIWDPGNAFFTGEEPYPYGYNLIKDYIAHIHVKDAVINDETGEPEWRPVGKGKIDFVAQFKALLKDDYRGVVSLETHYKPEGGTPEDGTRESFQGMKEALLEAGVKF